MLTNTSRGCSLTKILVHTQQKNFEKSQKIPRFFFENLKNRRLYLGVNNPSISVFKSFFIRKILVYVKKIRKKSEKFQ